MQDFLKNLGFPSLSLHQSRRHFDFKGGGRRMLVIGPMGSGKTEYSAGVWRDAKVALRKSSIVQEITSSGEADRRRVFFIRSQLDAGRFPDYPEDALAYRGGYERCGEGMAKIRSSFDLERVMADHPTHGTWIIDEASFYDERLAYVTARESQSRGLIFLFPTLVLNFRKEIFNSTARLLVETATDVFPLTAYCEHPDCLSDSVYTYRYYNVGGREAPALYFDPLIIIGGDGEPEDPREPNYCTRCDHHHVLPGKEYTYFTLKPLGETASRGDLAPLKKELILLSEDPESSALCTSLREVHMNRREPQPVCMNAPAVPCLAEKALAYLYIEENLVDREQLRTLTEELKLDGDYLDRRLRDGGRNLD